MRLGLALVERSDLVAGAAGSRRGRPARARPASGACRRRARRCRRARLRSARAPRSPPTALAAPRSSFRSAAAGGRGEPLRGLRLAAKRRIAAVAPGSTSSASRAGERGVDRPVVHRPVDRHARVDRLGRARRQRRRGPLCGAQPAKRLSEIKGRRAGARIAAEALGSTPLVSQSARLASLVAPPYVARSPFPGARP